MSSTQKETTKGEPASKKHQQQEATTAVPPDNSIGKEHELLKSTVGKWQVDCLFIMGGQEMKEVGHVEREMVIGGRFLRETFKCSFGGQPFEGEMMLGFFEGVFQSTWCDTSSNHLYIHTGKFVKGSTTDFELGGEPFKDMMSGKLKTTRQHHSIKSDKEFVCESYDTFLHDGVEKLSMRLTYRRV